jgi:ribosomal protein L23
MAIKPITPRATEKAYALSTIKNVYVFNVPLTLNKNQIKEAIEKEFEVTVTGVRTVVQAGKVKRINKSRNPKRYVAGSTTQKDIKKAYVTVKEGDKIAIFESAEAETAEEKK